MGACKAVVSGDPIYAYISTSHIERQNLTMRIRPGRGPPLFSEEPLQLSPRPAIANRLEEILTSPPP
jgi:hypothetical protein